MTLEAIYFIGQTVAAVALVVSLVFVGIQLRMGRKQAEEAERVARGQVIQNIAAELRQHANKMLAFPEVYRCFVNGTDPDTMTEDERSRFFTYCYSTLNMTQNIFLQHRRGLLDDQTYQSYLPLLVGFVASPAGRIYWARRKSTFHPDFSEMMECQLSEAPVLGSPDAATKAIPSGEVQP